MPDERREHPRIPVANPYPADILALTRMILGVAVLIDVSREGLCARTTCDYPTGEELLLEVFFSGRFVMTLPFKVIWSQENADGWRMGGLFKRELTAAEAARLIDGRWSMMQYGPIRDNFP